MLATPFGSLLGTQSKSAVRPRCPLECLRTPAHAHGEAHSSRTSWSRPEAAWDTAWAAGRAAGPQGALLADASADSCRCSTIATIAQISLTTVLVRGNCQMAAGPYVVHDGVCL